LIIMSPAIPVCVVFAVTTFHYATNASISGLRISPIRPVTFSFRCKLVMPPILLIVLPAISPCYRLGKASIHRAERWIWTLLPFRCQSSVFAHLLVVSGTIPPCLGWTVTVRSVTCPRIDRHT
jgi:hypothetical protein